MASLVLQVSNLDERTYEKSTDCLVLLLLFPALC